MRSIKCHFPYRKGFDFLYAQSTVPLKSFMLRCHLSGPILESPGWIRQNSPKFLGWERKHRWLNEPPIPIISITVFVNVHSCSSISSRAFSFYTDSFAMTPNFPKGLISALPGTVFLGQPARSIPVWTFALWAHYGLLPFSRQPFVLATFTTIP